MTAAWRPTVTRGALLLMETLWVYALVAFFVAAIAPGGRPTIFGVGAIVFLSFAISRGLQQSDLSLGVVRVWGVALSLLLFYAIVRLDFFSSLRLWDFTWADDIFNRTERSLDGHLAATFGIPMLWAFWMRGVLRGQQHTGFDEVVGSFAIGILIIAFVALFVSGTSDAPHLVGVIAVPYVAVGLIAIALSHAARADDEFSRSFGPTWLLAVGGAVLVLGVVALLFILIDFTTAANLLRDGMDSAAWVIGKAFYYITYPALWATEWVFRTISGPLQNLFGGTRNNQPFNQPDITPTPDNNNEPKSLPGWLQLLIKLFVAAPIVAGLLFATAVMFSRFRKRIGPGEVKESIYQEGRLGSDLGDLLGALLGRFRPNLNLHRDSLDQVRRLYFDMLEAAAQREVQRRPAETPLELSPRIEAALVPETPAKITRVFNAARYGETFPTNDELRSLRDDWEARNKR